MIKNHLPKHESLEESAGATLGLGGGTLKASELLTTQRISRRIAKC